ncbi:MAG: TPM domain-containing protein [Armatimonadetes bacterium]|nr:TPM domain-containing protein [Armatimonadota bacterium]
MKCPRCGLLVDDQVPRCRGCGFGIGDLDRRLNNPPERAGLVNDLAGALPASDRDAMAQRLAQIHATTGGELVVATVQTTKPVKPAEYVFWLFNRWEVGGPSHAGLLVLLAMDERRVECEVGYLWDVLVSDEGSLEILEQAVVPHLKEGRIAEGLRAGVERLADLIARGTPPREGDAR